jgi:hypothetical protein
MVCHSREGGNPASLQVTPTLPRPRRVSVVIPAFAGTTLEEAVSQIEAKMDSRLRGNDDEFQCT